jgi:hypothetical protein
MCSGVALKVRSRQFDGRCSRHKAYNPAVDGAAIREGCGRCTLLFEIWEASLRLNQLIRKFKPNHDDVKKPVDPVPAHDPRQMSLI